MTTINRIEPGLLTEIRRCGTFDAAGCFNCGSCTVVCDLTFPNAPFPRRSMQHGILGLKGNLRGSLEPWLCHDCGDCSTTCPRGAEPRESMMTLRRWLSAQYDWTGLTAKIYQSKAWKIGALAFAAVLFLALVVYYHLWEVGLPLPDFAQTPMPLEHMFGIITTFTRVVFLLPLLLLLTFAVRMCFFTMKTADDRRIPLRFYFSQARHFVMQFFFQRRMTECPQEIHKKRWTMHFILVASIFSMIFVKFFFLSWFQTDTVHPFYHPQRWLGYLATAGLLYSSGTIFWGRIQKKEEIYKFSEFSDWTLPILLLLTALTGLGVHITRLSGLELAAHYAYAAHLMVVVAMVMVELPFGRWSHMIYRPLAIYFQAVRDEALKAEKPLEEKAA